MSVRPVTAFTCGIGTAFLLTNYYSVSANAVLFAAVALATADTFAMLVEGGEQA